MDERERPNHAKEVLRSFYDMKNDMKYCDFILKIGEDEIPVHRNVLAASSTYFDAMFQHKMRETETGFAEILGIKPSAGKQCLEYIYTGKAKFSREEDPEDLVHAAELMQLHGLLDLYFEYLVENISSDNCLEYMELAVTYNKLSFARIFEKFLQENFGKVMKSEGFMTINHIVLSQCFESLPAELWNAEKLKWEALLIWVESDADVRRDNFPELFQLLKLENLPVDYLRETIANHALVAKSDDCVRHAFNAFCCGEIKGVKSRPEILSFNARGILRKYDLITEKWSRMEGKRIPDPSSNCVKLNGNYYCMKDRNLMRFSDGEYEWQSQTSLYYNSDNYHLVVCGSSIVICSRCGITVYNEGITTTFQQNSSLRPPIAFAASHDFVYAIEQSHQNKARGFNFRTESWQPISPMNYARRDGGIVVYRGKLIALGGYQMWNKVKKRQNTTIEYYEPAEDRWTVLPRCEQNFYSGLKPKPLVIENELYVLENDGVTVTKLELTEF